MPSSVPARGAVPPAPDGSGRVSWMLVAAAILALALAGAAAALVLTRNSGHAAPPRAQTVVSVRTVITRTPPPQTQAQATPLKTATHSHTAPTPIESAPSTGPFPSDGVTGVDQSGFNFGPGCSDDPASTRPGCSDSPDVAAGDPHGGCAGGITVDSQTTSCALAESVKANYSGDGLVTAFSPERSRRYQFNCQTAGPGTTRYTICLGQASGTRLYLRWHQ